MMELFAQIGERSQATPWMTAVRCDGKAVTYSELNQALQSYDQVAERHHLSENAALAAALLSFATESTQTDPIQQAGWVADAIAWMNRDVESATPAGFIRAV